MDLAERIRNAKMNDIQKESKKKAKEKAYLERLLKKVEALEPRITKLIDTANDLLDNDYQSFLKGFMSEGLAHHLGFVSEDLAHHFGFMRVSENGRTLRIDSMGIVNGGACGGYDFHTTGKRHYMTEHHRSVPVLQPLKVFNIETMLKMFGDFESRFYSELETFLANKGA